MGLPAGSFGKPTNLPLPRQLNTDSDLGGTSGTAAGVSRTPADQNARSVDLPANQVTGSATGESSAGGNSAGVRVTHLRVVRQPH